MNKLFESPPNVREGKTKEELLEMLEGEFWRNKYGDIHNGFDLEIIVSSGCNLGCRGCDHFSPIANEWFVDVGTLKEELLMLKERLPMIKNVFLIGGEPLLHPNFVDVACLTRDIFPNSDVITYTNGLLMNSFSEEDYITFSEKRISFIMTRYQVGFDYEKASANLDKYKINNNYTHTKLIFGGYTVNPEGTEDQTQFYTCTKTQTPVLSLKEGKIYKCPFSCCSGNITNIHEKIVIPETENDYLDIREITIERLDAFCHTPNDRCKYCVESGSGSWLWRPYDGDENSYLYSLKDYYLYDYDQYNLLINNKDYADTILDNEELSAKLDYKFHENVSSKIIKRYKSSKIDIIVPFYNLTNEIILQLMDTLASQTIIDDCVVYMISDGDPREADIYSAFDREFINCVMLKNEVRGGPGVARNKALECCYGEYIYFLDADDRFADSDSLERLYEFAKDGQYEIVTHEVIVEDKHHESNLSDDRNITRNFYLGDFIRENKILFPPLHFGEDGYLANLAQHHKAREGFIPYKAYVYNKNINSEKACRNDYSDSDVMICTMINNYCWAMDIHSRGLAQSVEDFYIPFLRQLGDESFIQSDSKEKTTLNLAVALWLGGRLYNDVLVKLPSGFKLNESDINIVNVVVLKQIEDNDYVFELDGRTSHTLSSLEKKIMSILMKKDSLIVKSAVDYLKGWL
ncbi:glycosyltransferase involved in cell wall biosynthesis [Clostridiales Family XIII bacterium PM5-7]